MSLLEQAVALAWKAHEGQTDRNGDPYILHPLRVAERVKGEDQKLAAILHDVVEDSEITLDDLRAESFSREVVAAVDALTRREEESYVDLVLKAAHNPIARPVKLSDLTDHVVLDHIHYSDENGTEDIQRIRRYIRAALFLQSRMSEEQYLAGASKDEKQPKGKK